MIEKPEKFDLKNPPGDRWIFVKPGKDEAEETSQDSLPQNWLEESGGRIMTGNENGQWFTFDKEMGDFQEMNPVFGGFVESLWRKNNNTRQEINSLFKTS